jgi:GNAT superfamily N-acetyltransferase
MFMQTHLSVTNESRVRAAVEADVEELAFLFDGYRQFYRYPSDVAAGERFLKARFALQDSVIYVAVEPGTGRLTGFAQLYPLWSSTRLSRLWLLNDLYVDPQDRGEGVSRLLIAQCKKLVKETNACGLQLETEKSNQIGNNLYQLEGFRLIDGNFYFWKGDNVT